MARAILGMKTKRTLTVREIAAESWLSTEDAMEALKVMDVIKNKRRTDGDLVISKAMVKEWVSKNNIDLTPPVNESNFLKDTLRRSVIDES